jgi:hypothetical protein
MDLSNVQWRKSSDSGVESNCVEVTFATGHVLMRDSKAPTGPIISCNQTEWSAFMNTIKNGNPHLP